MEVALRRRLGGVADVSISQRDQTAAVTFVAATTAFSAATFRDAIAEAGVDVLSIEIDACGVMAGGTLRWNTASVGPGFVIRGVTLSDGAVCVRGRLNDQTSSSELHVMHDSHGSG